MYPLNIAANLKMSLGSPKKGQSFVKKNDKYSKLLKLNVMESHATDTPKYMRYYAHLLTAFNC